jgi:RNA polymerase sigma factor (sigma-70 family)
MITNSILIFIISPLFALNSPHTIKRLGRENYKLVPYFAKNYIQKHKLTYDEQTELLQEGYIGLTEASKHFDTSRNCKFSIYGSWWIRRHLSNYIKKKYNMKEIVEFTEPLYHNKNTNIDTKVDEIYLDILEKHERDLIYKRYYQKLSRHTVAEEYGVSPEIITYRCRNIIDKLKVFNIKKHI